MFETRLLHDGLFEEDGVIWAPDGAVLAQSRQLGIIMPTDKPVLQPALAASDIVDDHHTKTGAKRMSDYTAKRIGDMEAAFGGGFVKARAELGVTSFGIQVVRLPPDYADYPEHDHEKDGQEEVYLALEGLRLDRDRGRARRARPATCSCASARASSARSTPAPRACACSRSAASPARPTRSTEFTELTAA